MGRDFQGLYKFKVEKLEKVVIKKVFSYEIYIKSGERGMKIKAIIKKIAKTFNDSKQFCLFTKSEIWCAFLTEKQSNFIASLYATEFHKKKRCVDV